MKTVEVVFQNLQSHENTRFTLKPGMNFILADGNNVGKSTIFKVLSRIAKAPNVAASKIMPLIRYGCSEAIAAFKFDGETVIARFTKYEREAAKVFFEHHHEDGEITRSVVCPGALLDALGIVVGENGEIINFNDANSVQLISEVSPEADTIITHVMLDPKVEAIKRNIYALGREVNVDARDLDREIKSLTQSIGECTFRPSVAEFFEKQELLEALCGLCDALPSITADCEKVPGLQDIEFYRDVIELCSQVEGLAMMTASSSSVGDIRDVADLVEVLRGLQGIPDAVESLQRTSVSPAELEKCRQLNTVISKLLVAVRSAEKVQTHSRRLDTLQQERQQVLESLQQNTRQIDCPIKGRVLYTDEKCVPYST